MKRWLFYLVHLVEAAIVLGVIYFEPTYCVRGTLRGESFFNGRPTSYWAAELERWEVFSLQFFVSRDLPELQKIPCFQREPTWFEQMQHRWLGRPNRDIINLNDHPEVLTDDPEAQAVLQELLQHSSPKVVRFAMIGLGLDHEFPCEKKSTP